MDGLSKYDDLFNKPVDKPNGTDNYSELIKYYGINHQPKGHQEGSKWIVDDDFSHEKTRTPGFLQTPEEKAYFATLLEINRVTGEILSYERNELTNRTEYENLKQRLADLRETAMLNTVRLSPEQIAQVNAVYELVKSQQRGSMKEIPTKQIPYVSADPSIYASIYDYAMTKPEKSPFNKPPYNEKLIKYLPNKFTNSINDPFTDPFLPKKSFDDMFRATFSDTEETRRFLDSCTNPRNNPDTGRFPVLYPIEKDEGRQQ
ncbi:MAG: hypothetical protein V1870_03895 [Candidatus Aenigmatarchaeota archaeon]